MSTVVQAISPAEIQYPDDDGEPMADNTLQFEWIVIIKNGLEGIFWHDPSVFVAGNLLWYPVEGNPTIRTAPDAMVAFGRPKGRRGSYKQWEEGNVGPHVVFEVLSPGNRAGTLQSKFEFYDRYGVKEYYIYDPDDGFLEGWARTKAHLEAVPRMEGFVSPLLRIRFEPGERPDGLTIVGPDGQPFETHIELLQDRAAAVQRADAERQRADAERERAQDEHQGREEESQRAEHERQRAEHERQRADRLAARLRDLGIDPD